MHKLTQAFTCNQTERHGLTQTSIRVLWMQLSRTHCKEKISLEVFQLARRQQLFPAVLHHLGNLDLHDLSVGAASVALRWWLQVSPPGERLNVITGVGKNRRPWRDGDLQSAVAKMLRKLWPVL